MKNFMKGCLPSSFPKMLGGHSITCQAKPLKQGLPGSLKNPDAQPYPKPQSCTEYAHNLRPLGKGSSVHGIFQANILD